MVSFSAWVLSYCWREIQLRFLFSFVLFSVEILVLCVFHDGKKKEENPLAVFFLSTRNVCALISSLFSSCPIFLVTLDSFLCFSTLKRAPIEFKCYNPQKAILQKPWSISLVFFHFIRNKISINIHDYYPYMFAGHKNVFITKEPRYNILNCLLLRSNGFVQSFFFFFSHWVFEKSSSEILVWSNSVLPWKVLQGSRCIPSFWTKHSFIV